MTQKQEVKVAEKKPLAVFYSPSGGFVQTLKKSKKNDLGGGDYEIVPPVLAEFETRQAGKGAFYEPKDEWELKRLREILAEFKANKKPANFREVTDAF